MAELLTFDGEALNGPIKCTDLSPLRDHVRRGTNRLKPLADGRDPVTLIRDQLERTFEWKVTGLIEPDGTPYMDHQAGLEANLEHYRDLFDSGGLHTLSFSFAAGTFTGSAQVPEYSQKRTSSTTAVLLTLLVIPSGELT